MKIVLPLATGVAGCEAGTAKIYLRGTSTLATYYTDFEGFAPVTSGATLTLDGYGRTTVYVNRLVDVVCYDSAGVERVRFTDGETASAVEVRSQSFLGTDYESGASAASNPVQLDTVLDLWKTSTGTTNFNILMQGAALSLSTAFWSVLRVFNVKDPAYGALGDGSTEDGPAISAAATALIAAGGGILYFPAGNYKVSGQVTFTPGTAPFMILGAGDSVTTISNHIVGASFIFSNGTTVMRDIAFSHRSTATVRGLYANSGSVIFQNCSFSQSSTTSGAAIFEMSSTATLASFDSCSFTFGAVATGNGIVSTIAGAAALNRCIVSNCKFTVTVASWNAGASGSLIRGCGVFVFGCTFSVPGTSLSGPYCVDASPTSGTGISGCVKDCSFFLNGGQAAAINLAGATTTSTYSEAGNSYHNVNADTVTYPPVNAAFLGSEVHCSSLSREGLTQQISNTAATVAVNPSVFGSAIVTQTSGAALTINLPVSTYVGPIGSRFALTVYNGTGAGLSVTLGTGFVGTWSATAIANTKRRTLYFVVMSTGGALRLGQVGSDAGDL